MLTYGFYNSKNHDRVYDALQLSSIFDGLIEDGVYAQYGNHLAVVASSQANKVVIKSGRAWFNHTWTYNDADLAHSMPEPHSSLKRIDAVVLDIDLESRINSISHISGPASASPPKPTWNNTKTHYRYPLAYVTRSPGVSTISQADIENAIGTTACPYVYNVAKGGVTINELLLQWKAQYNKWLDDNGTAWWNWFNNIQYILDGDVAGHLQSQIDEIAKFKHIYVVDKVLYVPMSGASVSGKRLTFAE